MERGRIKGGRFTMFTRGIHHATNTATATAATAATATTYHFPLLPPKAWVFPSLWCVVPVGCCPLPVVVVLPSPPFPRVRTRGGLGGWRGG